MAIGSYYKKRSSALAPRQKNGNIYYVRLKTEYGIFYKLGFTTCDSVELRLGYGGSKDHLYIDKVLLFQYSENAFDVENSLHEILREKSAFGRFSSNNNFLLAGNGQTEIYIEDVLRLDPDYKASQCEETKRKLREKKIVVSGKSQKQAQSEIEFFDLIEIPLKIFLGFVILIIFLPIVLLFTIIDRGSLKDELLGIFRRIVWRRKIAEEDDNELRAKVDNELAKIPSSKIISR